jgi:membrane-bound lytic murein transglycosylase B
MAKHRAGRGKHADRSSRRLHRLGRTATRATVVSSLLLPMPVAAAGPLTWSLADEVAGVSRVPVTGLGDPANAHALDPGSKKLGPVEPAASLTQLQKAQRAKAAASEIAANGIPAAALRAYRTAEATMSVADPGCRLSWQLLAGIGRIESDHGRYNGAVLGADGISTPAIIGLPLDGTAGVAAIADTDNGALDGDTRWDRAVGPMQFIPSTWAMVGVDGDADGTRNPHDLDDAALAAAAYLCVGEYDLSTPIGAQQAVYSYNHSTDYVALVLGVAHAYASGQVDLPLLTATLQLPTGTTLNLPQGRGVPIGATDDVSGQAKDKPAAKGNRADRGDDRAPEGGGNGAGNGAGHRTGGSPDRDPAGSNDRAGDDRTTDDRAPGGADSPDTDDPAGRVGDGNRADDGTDEPDVKPAPSPSPEPEEPEVDDPEAEEPPAEEPPAEEPDLSEQDQVAEGVLEDCDGSLCLVDEAGGDTIAVLPYEVEDYQDLIDGEVPVIVVYDLDKDGQTWENIEEPAIKEG